jgi:hypothetical protein
MAKTVSITLTSKGVDAGPFTLTAYSSISISPSTLLPWTKTGVNLVVDTPVQYTDLDETAKVIRITSTGLCTNLIDITIQ